MRATASLVDLLQQRAADEPDSVVYTFFDDEHESPLDYGELERRTRVAAAGMLEHAVPGDRVILLLPPGLDYICSFFGCLYAGVVAVPAYPPRRARLGLRFARVEAIVADARPRLALTSRDVLDESSQLATSNPAFADVRWLAAETLFAGDGDERPTEPSPTDLAFLQYTSGSTATPKGVMVSHDNLVANAAQIEDFFGLGRHSRSLIWLPPYHDMGLIGGILQALFSSYPVWLMSPADFVQRPQRWLSAVSRYRATVSGGPNFAYDLCTRLVTPDQLAELDLSSWEVAFNGAEPVRAEVLNRFAETFAPAGLQREALYPCYGLAEATLIVTGGTPGSGPVVKTVAAEADASRRPRSIVGCGRAHAEQYVVAVDPQTRAQVAEGEQGEIWVAGPSVAQGYWGRSAETAETFGAYLADTGSGPFLRTGDLGFLSDGELFITGRLKDVIIVHGLSYHPQDIEETVSRAHPALESGGGAAFTVAVDGVEQLVVVHEISRHHRAADPGDVIAAVRQAVGEEHDLATYAVVLLRPGRLPKTSSGKVQRHAARAGYLQGDLDVHARRTFALRRAAIDETSARTFAAAAEPERRDFAERLLREQVAARTGADPDTVVLDRSGPELGLDSIAVVEIQHALETTLGVEIPLSSAAFRTSFSDVAAAVAAAPLPTATSPRHRQRGALEPLSHGQRAVWFLDRIAPAEAAYNLAACFRLDAQVSVDVFEDAFSALLQRHPVLRSSFRQHGGELVQRAEPLARPPFFRESGDDGSDEAMRAALADAVHVPFDLETGPPVRLHVWTPSGQRPIILVVVHHIVSDFWSLALLLEELAQLYEAANGGDATLPPAADYVEYVDWQTEYLQSEAAATAAAYWLQQLNGELPTLDIPTDRPRPPAQSFRGGSVAFSLDDRVSRELSELARASDTTLYTVLLAAFQVLLHLYSGQTDVLVGSPNAGRGRSSFARTQGYFVNPVVIRGDLSGRPSFRSLLAQLRATVADALAHQDYPFALLVERLQPVRDVSRSPVFQAMFMYQQAPRHAQPELGLVALGRPGVVLDISGLSLESVELPQERSQFDVTLAMSEARGRLHGSIQYSAALFDRHRMQRMSSEFLTLLGGIATDPDLPIGRLPLLDGESRREVLTLGNDTAAPYEDDICVHHAIERQSAERPDAVAVVVGERELTYGELDAQADRVARHLTDAGIGPETFVGICLGRSFEMIVAALAVMKAGAAYVPLDPSHPDERLATIAADAELSMVLTERRFLHRVPATVAPIVATDQLPLEPDAAPASTVAHHVDPDNAVYVLYTSGSTGKPKGIVVTHRNVLNFFAAMDDRIGCDATDTLLAVTTIGFDISVLELFWTLACGARVALVDDDLLGRQRTNRVIRDRDKPLDFSLFYFANADAGKTGDKYRLVLDGARFADENGFTAVWTPERHFHEFGGLYPNPSVLSAALATITRNVQLRAGSVVLPLHSPLRVAEEWALVDNLSGGRVGIAFASGWHANDFVFFPDNFDERKELMFEALQTVQALWRGGSLTARGGAGNEIEVKIFPTPVQAELPTWITAAGSPDTFARAGEIGANLLTHLLGQSIDQVAANIRRYRHARALAGHDPTGGCVTLMLHTFVGSDLAAVQEAVREPFKAYLRSSVGLIANLVTSLGLPFDLAAMSEADMDALLSFAFERYFSTSALFGTPDSVEPLIDTLKSHDIDEVACLIDFGIDADEVLANLSNLALVCERANAPSPRSSIPSLAEYIAAHRPTLLQATPSMMRMIALDTRNIDALHSLRALLLGGERLPSDLASALSDALPTRVLNMYGPTETTIWSSTHEVVDAGATIPIGKPIANTYFHIVNPDFEPVPIGAAGELVIGGLGVARGYWSRPDLTAERFVPDPFGSVAGGRVYRTGDLARYREDGSVEFLGRVDQQVKIRGFRVELGEIEAVLARDPSTREVAVTAREVTPGDVRVAAYVVGAAGAAPDVAALTDALRRELPEYMVPSTIVVIDSLPRTANGKIALRALPAPVHVEGDREHVAPSSKLEVQIADVWKRLLELETVGIYENFFDLGGHSLLMARVHAELAPILGSDVPLVSLFEHPTVSALARHLDGDGRREQSFDVSQERARQQRRRRSAHAVERAPGSSG